MRPVLVMAAGIAVGVVVLLVAPAAEPSIAPTSHLDLEMETAVTAGGSLQILVSAEPGSAVDLYVVDSYGTLHRHLAIDDGFGLIDVAAVAAGRLDVVAISGNRRATASAVVHPAGSGPAPSPLVGARSIVADGLDRAMVVVIPEDRFGNPTGGAVPAVVTVVHPDGTRAGHDTKATATLQWTWVPSVTTAGRAQVVVDLAAMRGPTRTLIEIPSVPEPFSVEPITELRPADGLTLVEVATSPLADRFGSRIVDGAAAVVTTRHGDGSESVQTAVVVGGVARALIEAPGQPGVVHVTVTVYGVTSPELALEFEAPLLPAAVSHVVPLHLVPRGGGE